MSLASSTEKKTIVLLYLLIGIIVIMQKKRLSLYIMRHLQQSLGWWVIMITVALMSLLVIFIPYINLLPLLIIIILIGLWGRFVYQGREGIVPETNGPLAVFVGIGGWMLDVLDVHPHIEKEGATDTHIPSKHTESTVP